MVEDEAGVREVAHHAGGALELARKDLQVERIAMLGEQRQSAPPFGIVVHVGDRHIGVVGIAVPVDLVAHPDDARQLLIFGKQVTERRRAKIGIGDQRVGQTGLLAHRGDPAGFVERPCRCPVGLHVDGRDNIQRGAVRLVLFNQIIPPHRLIWPEDPRFWRCRQPRHVVSTPDVVVSVDDAKVGNFH